MAEEIKYREPNKAETYTFCTKCKEGTIQKNFKTHKCSLWKVMINNEWNHITCFLLVFLFYKMTVNEVSLHWYIPLILFIEVFDYYLDKFLLWLCK